MDFDAVRQAVDEAIDALWRTDPRDALFVRGPKLAASCEPVSIAIAAVLEDRGLGEWTFVQASKPGELNGHAWLEWRDEEGNALFSIDATLQQFPEYGDRFVDEGETPAAAAYTDVHYEGSIWGWKYIDVGSRPYTRVIAGVRAELARE